MFWPAYTCQQRRRHAVGENNQTWIEHEESVVAVRRKEEEDGMWGEDDWKEMTPPGSWPAVQLMAAMVTQNSPGSARMIRLGGSGEE